MLDRFGRALESPQAKTLANGGLVAVSVVMVLTIVLPATVWRAPVVDATYTGFDPVLMYHDATATGSNAGSIAMTPEGLTIAALPGSAPVVHLSTGPLSSTSSFDVTVQEAQDGTQPLVVAIWSPFQDYRFQLTFESEPGRRVLAQRVHQGTVFEEIPLGVYTVGQKYTIESKIDRQSETAEIRMRSVDDDTRAANALHLASTDSPFESHAISDPLVVTPGVNYSLEAEVKPLVAGLAGISVEWLDANGDRIAVESDWGPLGSALSGWEGRDLRVGAPPGASGARIGLATATNGAALFSHVRFVPSNERDANLLSNGSFAVRATGWHRAEGTEPLEVRALADTDLVGTISSRAWPELFASARMALTVSAASSSGFSTAFLQDYRVVLPHERWMASKVADRALETLLLVLGLTAFFIGGLWAVINSADLIARTRRAWTAWRTPMVIRSPALLILVAMSLGAFALGNGLLSHAGSLNADLIGARVWGYTAATYGPADLYYLPNLASSEAVQWNGLPLQEAGFPYGPVMAYVTWAQGLIYSLFLAPAIGTATGIEFDNLTRATNAIFALADAVVILLILRRMEVGIKASTIIAGAFLFNPAVWFAGSVWGTSQSVSLLFLLLSVLFTERRQFGFAWALLFIAMMTRPQNLIPGALLALYLLREQPIRESVLSVARATVAVFVVVLPLALTVSPTLPIDTIINALFLHVGSGNDDWTLPVSWGGMSIWPLVTPLLAQVEGVDRVLFPGTIPVVGSMTPHRLGNIALVLFLGIVAAIVARRTDVGVRRRDYPLTMALGAMALFMLPTGVPSYHFVLALALVFLTYRCMPRWAYVTCTVIMTTTTFLSMYTMGAYWLSVHPAWAVGVYDPASPVTAMAVALVLNDTFVTALVAANLVVFLVLCRYALRPMRSRETERSSDIAGLDEPDRALGASTHIGMRATNPIAE